MSRRSRYLLGTLFSIAFSTGCTTVQQEASERSSGPIGSSDAAQIEGYLERVGSKNAQARAEATREYNKETVRAFNLKTGKYQYVPADSLQRWNESEKRWEFDPDV